MDAQRSHCADTPVSRDEVSGAERACFETISSGGAVLRVCFLSLLKNIGNTVVIVIAGVILSYATVVPIATPQNHRRQ